MTDLPEIDDAEFDAILAGVQAPKSDASTGVPPEPNPPIVITEEPVASPRFIVTTSDNPDLAPPPAVPTTEPTGATTDGATTEPAGATTDGATTGIAKGVQDIIDEFGGLIGVTTAEEIFAGRSRLREHQARVRETAD